MEPSGYIVDPATVTASYATMEDGSSSEAGPATSPEVNNRPTDVSNTSQLFPSVPALSEAAAYISQSASYFSQCFTGTVGDGISDGLEPTLLTTEQAKGSTHRDSKVTFTRLSTTIKNSDDTSTSTSMHSESSTSSGPLQSRPETMRSFFSFQSGTSLFQDLVSRARKTVAGSAGDIGWLQRAQEMPPVEDGTKRFVELLENIRKKEHKLPNSMVYLLIPGLFSNHGPLYFVNTKKYFSKMGLTCHIAKIHSEASVAKNAQELKEYIEEIYWGSRKRVLLFGHSKGGVDAAAALSLYWSDLKDKVAGLVLAQSPYGGSPVAADILREGQLGDYVQLRKLMEILICKVIKGDLQALEDLTYEKRKEFISKHPLPRELPIVSFHTEAGITPAVFSTLSHVAHAELPLATSIANGQPTQLPVVMPLTAVMAACAQLLQVRYGEKSDGLVTRRDAEVPGSVVVRPDQKLDHAWMVYSSMNNDTVGELDASVVCEALLTLLVEVEQKRRHAISMKDE